VIVRRPKGRRSRQEAVGKFGAGGDSSLSNLAGNSSGTRPTENRLQQRQAAVGGILHLGSKELEGLGYSSGGD